MILGKTQGVLTIILGAIFMHQSLDLRLGTLTNIGPGFWPLLLSVFLVSLGVVMLCTSTAPAKEKNQPLSLWPIMMVLTSMILYAIIVTKIGLILTGLSVITVAMIAKYKSMSVKIIISSVIFLACIIVFLQLIGIDIPLLPVL